MLCKGTSFFRNFIIFDDDFRAKKHATQDRNLSDGKKRNEFLCFALYFLVTLPSEMANLLRLGIKKIEIFCSALDFLVTLPSEMAKLHALGNEKKTSFSFAFLSFF
ncbi:hypothetical protein [Prevotella sp. lc2012]|uniref:hypothetical protein n=1 Tax=Prevotella sp. lc2012 TaxID=1761886 RepID=UPI00089D1071|nr:hypothetical protein [Prevotella sp. lc2012]SEE00429.1 hypothetical protein SAMN04487828_0137 [Prevotella sp. lc2012]